MHPFQCIDHSTTSRHQQGVYRPDTLDTYKRRRQRNIRTTTIHPVIVPAHHSTTTYGSLHIDLRRAAPSETLKPSRKEDLYRLFEISGALAAMSVIVSGTCAIRCRSTSAIGPCHHGHPSEMLGTCFMLTRGRRSWSISSDVEQSLSQQGAVSNLT